MKRQLIVYLVFLSLAVCACGATVSPTPNATGDTPVNLVVGIEGSISIKRQGWTDYAPAFFGMALRSDDLLRLDGSSQATVACSDLTLAKAAGGVSAVPCKGTTALLMSGGRLVMPTRADAPLEIPLILSPRKTKLLSAHPILRWSPVAGATLYKVALRGPNLSWSSDVSGKTEIAYPNDAPALAAGATYKLSVSTGAHSSDEESSPGLGFTMLKPDEAQVIRDGETRIRGLGASDAATRLLLANLYAGQGLTAEAIEQMESLITVAEEPAIVRALGDLYLKIRLNRLAEERYTQALALSQKLNDVEGQAIAQNALGLVYEALGNKSEAVQRSQKAIAWYQKLGDAKTIAQIEARIAALQKP
jgi:hypothetical protein